jgi:glycerophosphoryl diester phosphodiesterase
MHDLTLDATTDIASHPEFEDRKSTKIVDGTEMSGYFAIDFTAAELATLTVRQRNSKRTKLFDGYFKIPTLDEIIDLVVTQYNDSGFTIGLFPETKDPAFHYEHGVNTGKILINKLSAAGFLVQGSDVPIDIVNQVLPVAIQCFDKDELKYLKTITDIPLVFLFSAEQALVLFNEEKLTEIKTYASSVSPEKGFFTFGNYSVAKSHMDLAHSVGLAVHPWTFKVDSVGDAFDGNAKAEEDFYICCLGIDGFFTEFADRSRENIDDYLSYEHGADCSIDCSLY